MRISEEKIEEMYRIAGVNRAQLKDIMLTMGKKNVKPQFRYMWSPENPFSMYCYVVTEWFYYYGAPIGSIPYAVKVPGDPGLHRFVRTPYGYNIDLTAEQFTNYENVDYDKARPSYFLQTGRQGPSSRARKIQELMGYDPEDWINAKHGPICG